MAVNDGYQLLDAGDGRRLERFGELVLDRPAPAARDAVRDADAWVAASARFDRRAGWRTRDGRGLARWGIEVAGLRLELRATDAGQVGLFPEQLGQLRWLTDRIQERRGPGAPPPRVLNLFASTGLVTLALTAAGAAVTHVDAARPTVAWARRNAVLSGLAERPIRWLVDDVRVFLAREDRRGRRYDGVVLDPPSYGHGTRGRGRRLTDELPDLLDGCARVFAPSGFVLLTAHTADLGPDVLASALAVALGRADARIERGDVSLRAISGSVLRLGAYARSTG